jgi:hypothetical protein
MQHSTETRNHRRRWRPHWLLVVLVGLGSVMSCGRPPNPVVEESEESNTPPASPVHLLDGCEIRSLDGALLKVLAGSLCVVLPSGDVISAISDEVVRYDPLGRILWRLPISAHHDMNLTPDGTLVLVSGSPKQRVDPDTGRVVFYDSFKHISVDGEVLFDWDSYEHRAELRTLHAPHPMLEGRAGLVAERYPGIAPRPSLLFPEVARITGTMPSHLLASWDEATAAHFLPDSSPEQQRLRSAIAPLRYYHLNSIQRIGVNALSGDHSAFRSGNYLVSFCNFSFLAIVDQDDGEVVWHHRLAGRYPGQHSVRLGSDGRITMFVNNEACPGGLCSSLVELDPITGQRTWTWRADPPESFHSLIAGSVERQPSGNYVASWSPAAGQLEMFEVTPEGEVVWRWTRPSGLEQGELLKFFIGFSRTSYSEVAAAIEGVW